MKIKLERLASGLILAPLAPIAGFMSFWFVSYSFLPEAWIPYLSVLGLITGILVDIFFLRKLLDHRLSLPLLGTIFLFYSIGIFGFFMGVPVFNAMLAIPAGFVIGSRLAADKADQRQVRQASQRTAWFTTGILALICAASAFIALVSSSTASDLRGMLGLSFEVTQGMILSLIVVGGAALLAFCWLLSIASVRLTYKFLRTQV